MHAKMAQTWRVREDYLDPLLLSESRSQVLRRHVPHAREAPTISALEQYLQPKRKGPQHVMTNVATNKT
jgi:hypothetical protein